jgi:AraC-like DNA-binding protein
MRAPMPVVWCFEDVDDYWALRRDSTYEVRATESASEICEAVARNEASGIVCGLSRTTTVTLPRIVDSIQGAGSSASVVLRLHVERQNVPYLLGALQAGVPARLSIKGFDSVIDDVTAALAGATDRFATPSIIRHLAPLVADGAKDLIIAAAIVGTNRGTVKAFARACGVSPRTIEGRLQSHGLVGPRKLLAWMHTAHLAWLLDNTRWPIKRIASEAGFSSTVGLSNFVRRHLGKSPRQIRAEVGFVGTLQILSARFESLR